MLGFVCMQGKVGLPLASSPGKVSSLQVSALARSKWELVVEKGCCAVASCAFIRVSEDRPINGAQEGQRCGQWESIELGLSCRSLYPLLGKQHLRRVLLRFRICVEYYCALWR
ncbi:hypothetical protein CEXT_27941 [Caerostris extrusa]|uniref:Uncharacterized protein n=1 Tax=Caerostris extrusa TaxID=172846 RepID=A0AAV4MT74_CAEEX|nr:hypothetical protein CEXT_27941 [Caerostris extrusa]